MTQTGVNGRAEEALEATVHNDITLRLAGMRIRLDRVRQMTGELLVRSRVRSVLHLSWALADQAVVSLASFLTSVLIARYLGSEEFGRFALAWLAMALAVQVQGAIVLAPMMSLAHARPAAERPRYLSGVFALQAVLCVVTAAATYVLLSISGWYAPSWGLTPLALPMAVGVALSQACELLRRYSFVEHRDHQGLIVDVVRYGSQISLMFVLLEFWPDWASLSGVIHIINAGSALACVAGLAFLSGFDWRRPGLVEAARENWRFAKWLLPTGIAVWGRDNIASVAAATYLGLTEAGALRAAQQIVQIVNVPLQALSNIAPQRAAAAYHNHGHEGLTAYVTGFVAMYFAVVAAMLVVIALAGRPLMSFIFGEAFTPFGFLVTVLALNMLLYVAREPLIVFFRAVQMPVVEFVTTVISALAFVAIAFPLASWMGLWGILAGLALHNGLALALTWCALPYWRRSGRQQG